MRQRPAKLGACLAAEPEAMAHTENDAEIGPASEQLQCRVGVADSARQLRLEDGDDFPDVLATSRMVGLMEVAAARLMRPWLKAGELSVGVAVSVEHLAATPLFERVRAVATYRGAEGRLHKFDVALFDDGGQVGRGTHTRAIVNPERLIDRARKRILDARGSAT
jgi:fluoroacetyl-CoA thioesterase